ncbi:MAG: DNA polymerase III subunit delta' [Pseudomonadales bacterium]|nr:DNA polymerase III subunit delta' [Pseudomonadales bacterium]
MLADVQPLSPLPWQAGHWARLVNLQRQDRLPHALLFHGVEGVGKKQLVRLLSHALLCRSPAESGLPCGQCTACALLAAGTHPDLFEAHPGYGSDGETPEGDASGELGTASRKSKSKVTRPSRQIKMDCIHDLIEFCHHAAHRGGRRVVVLEPAEALNHNAANALLKTLEEPGQGVHMLLVCHQPSRLLPTVRSRCQAWLCAVPPPDAALQWLLPYGDASRAAFALSISHGAPLRALQMMDAGEDQQCRDVQQALEAVRAGRQNWLQAGEALAQLEPERVLAWWWTWIHRECCERPHASLLRFADALQLAHRRISGTANPNPRLLLESLLIDWAALSV